MLSGNTAGIQTSGPNTQILGNYIGLAADGLAFASNTTSGVIVQQGADNTQVGGPGAGEGNLIAGNNAAGVVIRNSASGVLVRGNGIGINKNGEARRNLTAGVRIFDAAGNTIGGPNAADANTIAFNGAQGVDIDLTDPSGPNFEQPVGNQVHAQLDPRQRRRWASTCRRRCSAARRTTPATATRARTTCRTSPCSRAPTTAAARPRSAARSARSRTQAYKLRFWSNPAGGDQAETYLGEQDVTTNGAGDAPFTFTATPAIALGRTVTATATDAGRQHVGAVRSGRRPDDAGASAAERPVTRRPSTRASACSGFRTTSFRAKRLLHHIRGDEPRRLRLRHPRHRPRGQGARRARAGVQVGARDDQGRQDAHDQAADPGVPAHGDQARAEEALARRAAAEHPRRERDDGHLAAVQAARWSSSVDAEA